MAGSEPLGLAVAATFGDGALADRLAVVVAAVALGAIAALVLTTALRRHPACWEPRLHEVAARLAETHAVRDAEAAALPALHGEQQSRRRERRSLMAVAWTAESHCARLEAEQQRAAAAVETLRAERAALKESTSQLTAETATLRQERDALEAREREALAASDRARQEAVAAEAAREAARYETVLAQWMLETLAHDMGDLRMALDVAQAAAREAESARAAAEAGQRQAEEHLRAVTQQVERVGADRNELVRRIALAREAVAAAELGTAEAQRHRAQAEQHLAEATGRLAQAEAGLAEVTARHDAARAGLEETRQLQRELSADVRDLVAARAAAYERLDQLAVQRASREGSTEALERQLKAVAAHIPPLTDERRQAIARLLSVPDA